MKYLIKTACLFLLILTTSNIISAQKYISKTGHSYFMSHTDAIDIDGHNYQSAIILDSETGETVIIILIKSFEFSLATAEKHFNETYMESDDFPKAIFKGNIVNIDEVNFSKNGEYEVIVKGELTIHGETNAIEQPALIIVDKNKVITKCSFSVSIADYNIKVPKGVEERVAKIVDIDFDATLLKK